MTPGETLARIDATEDVGERAGFPIDADPDPAPLTDFFSCLDACYCENPMFWMLRLSVGVMVEPTTFLFMR